MRTLIGFAAGQAAAASNTSSGSATGVSGPPNSSVRWLVRGEMKLASR
jgi:hypothetical protein